MLAHFYRFCKQDRKRPLFLFCNVDGRVLLSDMLWWTVYTHTHILTVFVAIICDELRREKQTFRISILFCFVFLSMIRRVYTIDDGITRIPRSASFPGDVSFFFYSPFHNNSPFSFLYFSIFCAILIDKATQEQLHNPLFGEISNRTKFS